jgi:hypothetical protein
MPSFIGLDMPSAHGVFFVMAKRFCDTELWDKEWFMQLTPKHKLLFQFLFSKCDVAGVWQPNWTLASLYVGEKVDNKDLKVISNHVDTLPDGKIFIIDFINFQYGELTETCPPHRKVISLLKNYGIYERVTKGYSKGIDTLQDKEEDKEEDKDKEIEEEKLKKQNKEKEKKYGLKNSEMGKYSQQQIELFDLFYHWMETEAPNTLKMTEPLTLPQYISLRQKYDEPYMKSMFEKMHNYKPLIKNNVSTYKTFLNWAGKDAERKPTITPKNANSFI